MRGRIPSPTLDGMAGSTRQEFRSGDPLFAFDVDSRVLSWNRAAEELTGIPASEAVGRYCWEVLGGIEESGAMICHPGCSYARLAREGWPVLCHEFLIRTREGRRLVTLSTIGVKEGQQRFFLHIFRELDPHRGADKPATGPRVPALTPRQKQVLELMSEGVPAKVVSARLGLAQTTVRNHIRAVLRELGCHSQLAAVAKGRRLGLI